MGDLGFGYKSASKVMNRNTILSYLEHLEKQFETNSRYLAEYGYWNGQKMPLEKAKTVFSNYIANDLQWLDELQSDANINSILRDSKPRFVSGLDKLRTLNRSILSALRNVRSVSDVDRVREIYLKFIQEYQTLRHLVTSNIRKAQSREANWSGKPIAPQSESDYVRNVANVTEQSRQRSGRLA